LYAFVKAHTLLAHEKFPWKKEIFRYLILEVLSPRRARLGISSLALGHPSAILTAC
jgi:hypothetical protein